MIGSSEELVRGLAAARVALGRGDGAKAEQLLRDAIGTADPSAAGNPVLVAVLSDLAALRRDQDDPREAEALLERALAVLEGMADPDQPMLLAILSDLGALLAARGEARKAEALLRRALVIGELQLGSDHPDLGNMLNELSRLLLKEASYAEAEPLLVHLYDIKRRDKGEDHPEAATVLASIASVRQALGRHDEAEPMWRRVLAVRERTLAPNHFATATALEHLAESCAARGKLGEALQLLRRAVTVRELTLGAGHPSLRIARDRIADLRLQASDDALKGFQGPASDPLRFPPLSVRAPGRESSGLDAPPPQAEGARDAGGVALADGAGDEDRREFPRTNRPPDLDAALAMQAWRTPSPLAASGDEDEEVESEGERSRVELIGAAAVQMLQRRSTPGVIAGAAAVVLLLGVLATRSRASDIEASESMASAALARSARTASSTARRDTLLPGRARVPAPAPVSAGAAVHVASRSSATVAHDPAPATRQSNERQMNGDVVRRTSQSPALVAPVLSRQLMNNVDSFARAVKVSSSTVTEPYKVQLAAEAPMRQFAPEPSNATVELVRARLIGAAPQPRFPDVLRNQSIEGEVVVRFLVSTIGQPVASSVTVVRSPHERFSEAVRRVIPTMRFEPAHRDIAGAPAEADVVQMVFQFRGSTR